MGLKELPPNTRIHLKPFVWSPNGSEEKVVRGPFTQRLLSFPELAAVVDDIICIEEARLQEIASAFVDHNSKYMGKELLPRGEILRSQDCRRMKHRSWFPEIHDFVVFNWLNKTPEYRQMALNCQKDSNGNWDLGELGHYTHRSQYLRYYDLRDAPERGAEYEKFCQITQNYPYFSR